MKLTDLRAALVEDYGDVYDFELLEGATPVLEIYSAEYGFLMTIRKVDDALQLGYKVTVTAPKDAHPEGGDDEDFASTCLTKIKALFEEHWADLGFKLADEGSFNRDDYGTERGLYDLVGYDVPIAKRLLTIDDVALALHRAEETDPTTPVG